MPTPKPTTTPGDTSDKGDLWYGSATDDTEHGQEKNDFMWGFGGGDKLYGDAGRDVLYGGAGNDELRGGADNDLLYGEAGNDELRGEAANDVLYGGAGNDKLWGGAGNDVLHDGAGWNELRGEDGDDVLVGTGKMFGGAGEDTLIATGGAQVWGGAGADILIGSGGRVMYNGKAGVPQTGVTVDLQNGWGREGDAEGDLIFGFTGIVGSRGDDTLMGDEQDNFFRGMDGKDKFYGREGNDTVAFGSNGGTGATVDLSDTTLGYEAEGGQAGGDTFSSIENLIGSEHNDVFTGNGKRNWLSGRDGDDTLHGMAGNDSLGGGKGTDTLNGGKGLDDLSGNEGADTFVFDKDGLAETDRVWDFSGLGSDGVKQASEHSDKLDLSGLSGLKTAEGTTITELEFIPDKKPDDGQYSPGTTGKGKVWYWHQPVQDTPPEGQHGKWTTVAADLDGDGDADFQVELYGHLDLTVADFVGVVAEPAVA